MNSFDSISDEDLVAFIGGTSIFQDISRKPGGSQKPDALDFSRKLLMIVDRSADDKEFIKNVRNNRVPSFSGYADKMSDDKLRKFYSSAKARN